MKRLAFNIILSGVLGAFLIVFENWKWQPPTRDFVATYNPIIWGIFASVFFAILSIFSWNAFRQPQIMPTTLNIIGILILTDVWASLFYILRHRDQDIATILLAGLVFKFFPALIGSIVSFLLLVLVGRLISISR